MSPLLISSAVHLALVAGFILSVVMESSAPESIEIEVIQNPVEGSPKPPQLSLATKPEIKPEPPPPEEPARKVFGVSRRALTEDANDRSSDDESASLKQGNTLATEPDGKELKDSDVDSLPIPADEFLVSRMPLIQTEFKIPYPPEAKEKRIEGQVVLDLLIDGEGRVRDVKLIRGLGFGLDEAALTAIKQFKFSPAEIEGRPVAVRTRFTYNFFLEK